MTEREKQLIEAYIPSPKDTSLGVFEYYAQDSSGRVQKVEIVDILPYRETTYYGIVQVNTRKHIKGWREYEAFAMGDLYDNKEDCKNDTHLGYDYWENLRKIQEREAAL